MRPTLDVKRRHPPITTLTSSADEGLVNQPQELLRAGPELLFKGQRPRHSMSDKQL